MLAELEKRALEKTAFEAQLKHQALNDDLTGLPNRRLLADRLRMRSMWPGERAIEVALLYIDLDGFKLVNDSLGHAVGDLLLQQVADRLRSRVRSSDTLARLGGDEFAIVLSGTQMGDQAGVVADRSAGDAESSIHGGGSRDHDQRQHRGERLSGLWRDAGATAAAGGQCDVCGQAAGQESDGACSPRNWERLFASA